MRSTVLANRRKTRRHAVRIPCQVVREHDFRLISEAIIDLSMSGMVALAAHWVFGQSLLTGDRLIVSFQLPNSSWIDTEATVTRIGRGRRRGEHTPTFALEFDPLPRFTLVQLRRALRGFAPSPSRPRPGRRSTEATTQALLHSNPSLPIAAELAPVEL